MHKKRKALCLSFIVLATGGLLYSKLHIDTNTKVLKQIEAEKNNITLDGNWMYLTKEQRLKDFDYLYQQLKENYPYFKVVKRVRGIDLDAQYKVVRDKIANCTSDKAYFEILGEYCNVGIGHMQLWGRCYQSELARWKEDARLYKDVKPYYDVLNNPTSIKNYMLMEAYYSKEEEQMQDHSYNCLPEDEFENVETRIIKQGEIAYVEINSFNMDYYDESKKKLLDFYKEVKDYKHLIIDISHNTGGGMSYFDDLIAAPNIDQSLAVTTYMLIKNGENNERHLGLSKYIQSGEIKPIKEIPNLPNLIRGDLEDIDYFKEEVYMVKPSHKQKVFKGKIWMLVSDNVYSSSEYAAMFAKASGFATLVGTQTGGDGIGVDTAHIVLPESGLVVQYSPIYGLSNDGTGSEEFGTTPDIISENGQSPLQTCLNAIANE